jgi:hypothetical protein
MTSLHIVYILVLAITNIVTRRKIKKEIWMDCIIEGKVVLNWDYYCPFPGLEKHLLLYTAVPLTTLDLLAILLLEWVCL